MTRRTATSSIALSFANSVSATSVDLTYFWVSVFQRRGALGALVSLQVDEFWACAPAASMRMLPVYNLWTILLFSFQSGWRTHQINNTDNSAATARLTVAELAKAGGVSESTRSYRVW